MQTSNSFSDDIVGPDKLRDSGIGSFNMSASANDESIFQFDENDESNENKEVIIEKNISTEVSATPLSNFASQMSEVFQIESSSLPSKGIHETHINTRLHRSSFKSRLQTIDTIVPVGKQRHTNFTPPRLSPSSTSLEDLPQMFNCSIHNRRSSACLILCQSKNLETQIGEGLRSLSDCFNVQCVGLEQGYHLQNHPHSIYNRAYSSSYPGSPSIPDVQRESIQGMKIRKTSVLL